MTVEFLLFNIIFFCYKNKDRKNTIESISFPLERYLKSYFNRVTNLLSMIFLMFLLNEIFLKLEYDWFLMFLFKNILTNKDVIGVFISTYFKENNYEINTKCHKNLLF